MATNVEIANLALTRLGHDSISAFSPSGNKAARWFDSHYEGIKLALLRAHQWNFAIRRAVPVAETIRSVGGITQTNPAVVTSSSHGFSNGETVYIAGVIGMGEVNARTFVVANAATDTFELSDTDASEWSAYQSGGYIYAHVATEFTRRFPLPDDCIRLMRVNAGESTPHRVEGRFILTDESALHIEYVSSDVTETAFDGIFVDLLASRLSAERQLKMARRIR